MIAKIDSFKIRILKSDCQAIDKRLMEYWGEVSENGEITDSETWKRKSLQIKENGISTHYALQKLVGKEKLISEYVVILINAKLLKQDYFKGITRETIEEVYKILMEQNIVHFGIAKLLYSPVTDLDICADFNLEKSDQWAPMIDNFKKLTKPTTNEGAGYSATCNESIKIIQWSKRKIASITYPHVKIYAKSLELLVKSNHFKLSFGIEAPDTLARLEATIKNADHYKSFGFDPPFTLAALMGLSNDDRLMIIRECLKRHLFADQSMTAAGDKSVSVKEILALSLLAACNNDLYAAIGLAQATAGSDKDRRYNVKKALMEVYKQVPDDQKHNNPLTKFIYQ